MGARQLQRLRSKHAGESRICQMSSGPGSLQFDDADVAAVANKRYGAVDVGIVAYKYAVFERCGYWVAEVAAENDFGLELKWE